MEQTKVGGDTQVKTSRFDGLRLLQLFEESFPGEDSSESKFLDAEGDLELVRTFYPLDKETDSCGLSLYVMKESEEPWRISLSCTKHGTQYTWELISTVIEPNECVKEPSFLPPLRLSVSRPGRRLSVTTFLSDEQARVVARELIEYYKAVPER